MPPATHWMSAPTTHFAHPPRYFVIRALDEGSGQHAFVGIGFTERTDAFDFNVALSDHFKHEKLEKKVAEQADEPCVPSTTVPPPSRSFHSP